MDTPAAFSQTSVALFAGVAGVLLLASAVGVTLKRAVARGPAACGDRQPERARQRPGG